MPSRVSVTSPTQWTLRWAEKSVHLEVSVVHDTGSFQGILRIIGGCGRWQLGIYLLISLQQIPHAMFNLSIIYMMFKPDHWCHQVLVECWLVKPDQSTPGRVSGVV